MAHDKPQTQCKVVEKKKRQMCKPFDRWKNWNFKTRSSGSRRSLIYGRVVEEVPADMTMITIYEDTNQFHGISSWRVIPQQV